jgi:transcriptional regulator with XRE-family HTH domain
MKQNQKSKRSKRLLNDTDFSKVIGPWLREKRKTNKIGQVFLAQEIGTSQSRISKIESGILIPNLVDVLHMTNALNISDELFLIELKKHLKIPISISGFKSQEKLAFK